MQQQNDLIWKHGNLLRIDCLAERLSQTMLAGAWWRAVQVNGNHPGNEEVWATLTLDEGLRLARHNRTCSLCFPHVGLSTCNSYMVESESWQMDPDQMEIGLLLQPASCLPHPFCPPSSANRFITSALLRCAQHLLQPCCSQSGCVSWSNMSLLWRVVRWNMEIA